MKFLAIAFVFALPMCATAEEVDLNKAFQSEYVYLISQKEALQRQKTQMEQGFLRRTTQTKTQVVKLQKEVARLSATNDSRHEELTQLERLKKEIEKRGTSLESTYKKAAKMLAETERGLHFDTNKDKFEASAPANLKLAGLDPLFQRADELLKASGVEETFAGYYLDGEDHLISGEVTRLGRVAAFGRDQSGAAHLLGPSGTGILKVLSKADRGIFYLFDNPNEVARLQHQATWLEHLADLGPIFFLLMMFGLVAGLFTVLVKV